MSLIQLQSFIESLFGIGRSARIIERQAKIEMEISAVWS